MATVPSSKPQAMCESSSHCKAVTGALRVVHWHMLTLEGTPVRDDDDDDDADGDGYSDASWTVVGCLAIRAGLLLVLLLTITTRY